MNVLDAVVAPDGVVDAGPAQGLEGVIHVRQGDPAVLEELGQQGLVGKVHVDGAGLHELDDALVVHGRRVDDLQTAVHEAEGPDVGVDALGLGGVGLAVLEGEGAVLGDPVGRVVGALERVADAGVARGEDALARARILGAHGGRGVQLQVHELVHVLEDEHVRVELDDAGVLDEGEGRQLGPAVVEARVVGVVAALGGQQVGDLARGDPAGGEGGMALRGERAGGEGDEGILCADALEGVVEGQETGQIVKIGDQGCPDCWRRVRRKGVESQVFVFSSHAFWDMDEASPLSESTTFSPVSGAAIVRDMCLG